MTNQTGILSKLKSKLFLKLFLYFAVFVVFMVIMDKVVMPSYVHLGDEIEMPDVEEMSLEEAKSYLERQDFSVIIADSVYDSRLQKGTIVEQMPYAFSQVKRGRHVYLTVSIGKKPIIMPNLFYKSQRDAELIIKSFSLQLGSKLYEYTDIAVEGVVTGQSFPQGQVVKEGAEIDITISLGPFPTSAAIPELIGKNLKSARVQLRKLGVSKITIEYEERENILPSTVLEQDIKPGSKITDDTEITLTVSKLKPVKE